MNIASNLIRSLRRQFYRPSGVGGRLANWIMASRSSNRERNLWAVQLLDLQDGLNILEIGPGPGLAAREILGRCRPASFELLDHSQLVIDCLRRELTALTSADQLSFRMEDIEQATLLPQSLDRIYSSNVAQFWENPEAVAKKLRRALRPGGKIVTNYLARHRGATSGNSEVFAKAFAAIGRAAGFEHVQVHTLPLRPIPCAAIVFE
ncbi:MAG: class I SAM-dependent methyltransferase [Leptospirales bacterium]|nr:class I SAM-dependent methyltransferase [Leptospirales bacterium]